MDLLITIEAALRTAQAYPDEGDSPSHIHRNRSKHFVEALAVHLRDLYSAQTNLRVLSKHFDGYRHEFGLNELLYDVLVCETSTVLSAAEATPLLFVTRGLWAVESEFARNSREAVHDFNKLVLAATESKLFVGPQVADEAAFIAPLLAPAVRCKGAVYVALVTHPAEWRSLPPSVHLHRLHGDTWEPVHSEGGSPSA